MTPLTHMLTKPRDPSISPTAWIYPYTAAEAERIAKSSPSYMGQFLWGTTIRAEGESLLVTSLSDWDDSEEALTAIMEATPDSNGVWWCRFWFVKQTSENDTTRVSLALMVHYATDAPDYCEELQDHCAAEEWWNFLRALASQMDSERERKRSIATVYPSLDILPQL